MRDEASTHIKGWWSGRGEGDPFGHLLHVSHSHSSYVGRAYHPNQLLDLKVLHIGRTLGPCCC